MGRDEHAAGSRQQAAPAMCRRILHCASSVAKNLERRQDEVELLLRAVGPRPEIIVSTRIVFAVVAGSTDPLGLAWVYAGKVRQLEARGRSDEGLRAAYERLRGVHAAHRADVRCEAFLCGRRVTVVPSRRYAWDLECAVVSVFG